ncbi:hypothetical protein D3C86_1457530 [compost metagenome]
MRSADCALAALTIAGIAGLMAMAVPARSAARRPALAPRETEIVLLIKTPKSYGIRHAAAHHQAWVKRPLVR